MMRLQHFDGISRTPAMPIAVRAWEALIHSGHSDGQVMLNWDDRAVVAFDHDAYKPETERAIGVIVWVKQLWLKQAFVKIGYVLPECRRQGVYRAMFGALVAKLSADEDMREITSMLSPGNHVMREVAASMGREIVGLLTSYTIPRTHATRMGNAQ